jgi:hypothetical protein
MWLLDDLEPADEPLLRSELPGPVIRFLRWRYGAAYEREAALAWGPFAVPGEVHRNAR